MMPMNCLPGGSEPRAAAMDEYNPDADPVACLKAHAAALLGLTRDQIRTRLKRLDE